MIKKIVVKYVDRNTGCPYGTKVFTGPGADVLSANFQSAHPELREVSFEVVRR